VFGVFRGHFNTSEYRTMKRSVFFLSDRTGITAETLGHSLLTQFEGVTFRKTTLAFLDTVDKAHQAVAKINNAAAQDGAKPLLFSTLLDEEVREIIDTSDGMLFDFFDAFINPLELELGVHSAHAAGRSHGMGVYSDYKSRIDAVNFAMGSDDGNTLRDYPNAEVILVGVSRSGKTPTSLYLALQYGIRAANYPLIDEDLDSPRLPDSLRPFRDKLFGLTIAPERLQQIRSERRPDSTYASIQQCRYEVRAAEAMLRAENIPYLDTSAVSIEEIATTMLHQTGLKRRLYG
jgi:[pyruvate, water dikinase]-phosphate phosphotransferase / [pyruvate, water dikinase] kinase